MTGCIVICCPNRSENRKEGVTFHRLPSSPTKRRTWLIRIRRDPTDIYTHRSVICSEHFLPGDFVGSGSRRFIRPSCYPSQNLPSMVIPRQKKKFHCVDPAPQTPIQISESTEIAQPMTDVEAINSHDVSLPQPLSSSAGFYSRSATSTELPEMDIQIIPRFPADPAERNLWFSLVGFGKDTRLPKNPEICSDHFDPKDIITVPSGRRFIKRGATPQLQSPLFVESASSSRHKAAKANAALGTNEISPNQIQHETENNKGTTDAVTSILEARIWAMNANREDLLEKLNDLHKAYTLCESHFEENMFTSHLHTRLVATAIPTLFPSLEESFKPAKDDHSYSAPLLLPAKIRVLEHRVLVPSVVAQIDSADQMPPNTKLESEVQIESSSLNAPPPLMSPTSTQTSSSLSSDSPRKMKYRQDINSRTGIFRTLNEGAEISPNEIKKETEDIVESNEAGPSRVETRTGLFCTLNQGAEISPKEIKKETEDIVYPNEAGPSRVDFSDCRIKTEENDEEPESFEITGNDSRYIEQLTPDNFLTPQDRLKHVGLIKRIYVSQSNRIRNLQGTVQRLNYLVKSLEEFIDDNEDLSPKRPRVQ